MKGKREEMFVELVDKKIADKNKGFRIKKCFNAIVKNYALK